MTPLVVETYHVLMILSVVLTPMVILIKRLQKHDDEIADLRSRMDKHELACAQNYTRLYDKIDELNSTVRDMTGKLQQKVARMEGELTHAKCLD